MGKITLEMEMRAQILQQIQIGFDVSPFLKSTEPAITNVQMKPICSKTTIIFFSGTLNGNEKCDFSNDANSSQTEKQLLIAVDPR